MLLDGGAETQARPILRTSSPKRESLRSGSPALDGIPAVEAALEAPLQAGHG